MFFMFLKNVDQTQFKLLIRFAQIFETLIESICLRCAKKNEFFDERYFVCEFDSKICCFRYVDENKSYDKMNDR